MLSEWTPRLRERFGSPERLAGIRIFHDFRWIEVFGHDRGQFRNGQYLAELVKEKCPSHLRPALLLTIRDDVQETGIADDRGFYVVVVRIHRYLQMASGNAATTYFAMQLPTNIINAQSLDWSRLTSQQVQGVLDEHLDVNQLSTWLNARPNRVQLLIALFAENSNSDVLETLLAEHSDLPTLLVRLAERRPDAARVLAEIVAANDESLSAVLPLLVARPELWRLAEARDNLVPMLLPEQRSTLLTSLANELGDSLWTTLESAGINLPRVVAERAIAEQRRQALRTFEENIVSHVWTEPGWQAFFRSNTWIFGYGLAYRILSLVQEQPETGGRDLTGSGGVVSDYLYATEAAVRFTVLVEIKRPDSELVRTQVYRNRVHKLGEDLIEGVVQIQQQCHQWEVQGSQTSENRELLEPRGIFTHEPKGIVVIGDTARLDTLDKRRTFESYRRNLVNPEIVTFDELLERARFVVDTEVAV